MAAEVDCELIRAGVLGQPANAISSLAFVAFGLALIRRRPLIGWGSVGVGVGSFLFHGPMPPWGEWAHDVTLVLLFLAVGLERRPVALALAGLGAAVAFAFLPAAADPITAAIVGVVVGALAVGAWRRRDRRTGVALALLAAGAVVGTLSRTGWPLCRPESPWQGHAFWHLAAAMAVWMWATGVPADR